MIDVVLKTQIYPGFFQAVKNINFHAELIIRTKRPKYTFNIKNLTLLDVSACNKSFMISL